MGAKKKTAAKRSSTRADPPVHAAPDGRVTQLLEALLADPQFERIARAFRDAEAAGGRRSFGANGLKVEGKLFALFTQGTLVVKLPKARVAALVAAGVGTPFDPGHGRLMKEWLTVTSATAAWLDLAKEAHAFVKASGR